MKIAIIGACGYVGSMLYDDLKLIHEVECFDIADSIAYPPHHRVKASEVDVKGFDVILYFAGVSRKADCERMDYPSLHDVTVTEIVKLVEKMDDTQVCMYASTGSLYYNQRIVSETDRIDETCLQKYETAMLA
jgi:malate/lactate dehydrogenase